jgi:hypothetical protein
VGRFLGAFEDEGDAAKVVDVQGVIPIRWRFILLWPADV